MKVQGDKLLVLPYGAGHNDEGEITFPDKDEKTKLIIPDTVEEDPRKQSNKYVVAGTGNGEEVKKLDPVPEEGDFIYIPNVRAQGKLPVVTLDKDYLMITPDQVVHVVKQ